MQQGDGWPAAEGFESLVTELSKADLLEKIAKSEDWRAAAWLVERLEKEPDTETDGVDELEKKRAARKAS